MDLQSMLQSRQKPLLPPIMSREWERCLPNKSNACQRNNSALRNVSLWLDDLPHDINVRIAKNMHSPPSCKERDLLVLGNISEKLRRAVADSLSNKFIPLVDCEMKNVVCGDEWAKLFVGNVRHIDLSGPWEHLQAQKGRTWLSLFKEPTLRSVSISDNSELFLVAASAPYVEDVTIVIHHEMEVMGLVYALGNLNPTRLRFVCEGLFENSSSYEVNSWCKCPNIWNRLAQACPRLHTLEIQRTCASNVELDFKSLVNSLSNLKELVLDIDVTEKMLENLSTVPFVKLNQNRMFIHQDAHFDPRQLFYQAPRIGSAVTSLGPSDHKAQMKGFRCWAKLNSHEVEALQTCPRMQHVALELIPGAECSLPEWPQLNSLELSWDALNVVEFEFYREALKESYHKPRPGFFSRLSMSYLGLKKLRLFKVHVSMHDISLILRALGSTLEIFGTSVLGQNETPGQRAVMVFHEIRHHCKLLKRLDFCKRIQYERQGHREHRQEWERTLLAEVHVLERCLPQLDVMKLLKSLERSFGGEFRRAFLSHSQSRIRSTCLQHES